MKNQSGDILRLASASGFAGRPVAFGSLTGFGRERGGRFNRVTRDFVPSADG